MSLKAVLFDMDGVIVDTEPLNRKSYFQMFEFFNLPVTEELYCTFIGRSTDSVCQQCIDIFAITEYTKQDLVQKKRQIFKTLFDTDPEFDLIPGVRNLIENYYKNGIKLVLASSASMQTINWVLGRFELDHMFVDKISGAELKQSKPHPEIFEKAAVLSGEAKNNCIVIEDSTNGIQAAHSAGIFCVAYKSEHSREQIYDNASLVISDYEEILYESHDQWFKGKAV